MVDEPEVRRNFYFLVAYALRPSTIPRRVMPIEEDN